MAGIDCRVRIAASGIDLLNLLDTRDWDASYFYASRLPGEFAAGIGRYHLNPAERSKANDRCLRVLTKHPALLWRVKWWAKCETPLKTLHLGNYWRRGWQTRFRKPESIEPPQAALYQLSNDRF